MKDRFVIDCFLSHNLSKGQICFWGLHFKTRYKHPNVHVCVALIANF